MGQDKNNPFDGYPCEKCGRKQCNHKQCLKWVLWFKKSWIQVTSVLKGKEE